jgi:hypothetical protein
MNVLLYIGYWIVIVAIVFLIYTLFLVSRPIVFFKAVYSVLMNLPKIKRVREFVRKDYQEFKVWMLCKTKGHIWENGNYGRCTRNCGWHKCRTAL